MYGRECLYVLLTALVALPTTADAQDLIIKPGSTTAPASGGTNYSGQTFTVKCTVKNSSTVGFTQNFYLYYYYCPAKTTVLTSCTYLLRDPLVS
jgi:hypothetical protein